MNTTNKHDKVYARCWCGWLILRADSMLEMKDKAETKQCPMCKGKEFYQIPPERAFRSE